MKNFRSVRPSAIAAVALVLGALAVPRLLAQDNSRPDAPAAASHAALMIELAGVPDSLSLPLEAKENRIVTATVRGGDAAAVWVARTPDAKFSLPVPAVGDHRYQFNLGDADLALALRRTGASGQFYVFARNGAGETARSVPVSFQASDTAAYFVVAEKTALNGQRWFDPTKVTELQVQLDPVIPGVFPTVDIAGKSVPMKQTPGGAFSLPLTAEMIRLWAQEGAIDVKAGDAFHERDNAFFFAIPNELAVPAEGMSMWVTAHSQTTVPGSRNYLSLTCGDVKPESVWLSVNRADASPADPDLKIGQVCCFQLGGHAYAWGPTAIDYLGPAETRVKVTIWSGAQAEEKAVSALPLWMAASAIQATMTFNGRTYEGADAVKQLAELISASHAETVQGLLDVIAAREEKVGSQCRVRQSNNPYPNSKPLSAWVMDKLSEMGWQIGAEKTVAR